MPAAYDWSAIYAAAEQLGECHRMAVERGWWSDPADPGQRKRRNVGEALMLIVSEIGEAMEGHRKSLHDDHLPDRPSVEVELADAVIRIFDLAGGLGLDLPGAIVCKMRYNAARPDHDPAARQAAGGKAY